jgi:hypothetical protein
MLDAFASKRVLPSRDCCFVRTSAAVTSRTAKVTTTSITRTTNPVPERGAGVIDPVWRSSRWAADALRRYLANL